MLSIQRKAGENGRKDWIKATSSTPGTSTLPNVLPVPVVQAASTPYRRKPKNTRVNTFNARGIVMLWQNFRRRIGTVTAPSTSSVMEDSAVESNVGHGRPAQEENEEVDEVVVDRIWSDEMTSSAPSELGASPEKSGGSPHNATSVDHESLSLHEGFWSSFAILVTLRWRIWPAVHDFFNLRFFDEKSENHYRQEVWFVKKVRVPQGCRSDVLLILLKPLALWSSLFVSFIFMYPRSLIHYSKVYFKLGSRFGDRS